jgi:hypothetical protein
MLSFSNNQMHAGPISAHDTAGIHDVRCHKHRHDTQRQCRSKLQSLPLLLWSTHAANAQGTDCTITLPRSHLTAARYTVTASAFGSECIPPSRATCASTICSSKQHGCWLHCYATA